MPAMSTMLPDEEEIGKSLSTAGDVTVKMSENPADFSSLAVEVIGAVGGGAGRDGGGAGLAGG